MLIKYGALLVVFLSSCAPHAEPPMTGAQREPQSVPAGTPPPAEPRTHLVQGQLACNSDSDCAPAACCHASACVAASEAPRCEAVTCPTDYRPGTMDCKDCGCLCQ